MTATPMRRATTMGQACTPAPSEPLVLETIDKIALAHHHNTWASVVACQSIEWWCWHTNANVAVKNAVDISNYLRQSMDLGGLGDLVLRPSMTKHYGAISILHV